MVTAISDQPASTATAASAATAKSSTGPDATDGGAENFASLFRALKQLGRRREAADPQVTKQVAAQMVSELFLTPLMTEMREFPFGRELATGGLTESAFGQQFDQRVGDMVAAHSPGVLAAVVRYLKQRTPTTAAKEVSSEA